MTYSKLSFSQGEVSLKRRTFFGCLIRWMSRQFVGRVRLSLGNGARVHTEKRCYLCGSTEKLTRDHVPPKGLFPTPRPSNLHTIPCCFSCNNAASKDVEYFRLATSALFNRNLQGTRIWERVVNRTLTSGRIKDLIAELRKSTRPVRIETPSGVIEASEFSFTAERINRVLVRTTRGFLSLWHPEVDGSQLDFQITQIHQFKLGSIATSGATSKLARYTMGDGVYQHWRGLAVDPRRGMWIHLFYEAAAWAVMHTEGNGRITVHGVNDWEQRL